MELHDAVRLPANWNPAADSLANRVVLIVGAAGALGRASALACALAAAKVVLLGRKVRALEKIYDEVEAVQAGAASIYPLDLEGAAPQDYADLAATIEREFGRLDGIVFAAAHFDGLQSITTIKPADWLRAMQVNINAPFALIQACAELLVRASGIEASATQKAQSSVVFVLDDPARTGKAFWGAYGVGKFALAGFASILHEESESSPLRVHALLPAPMRSTLRRNAYFGENTLALPDASHAADAVVYLLGDEGAAARGKVLDLR
ncbi:MAG: SDR family NAD(P)-dependent oxidoreductase [Gammaproteobacteria bacterium]|nr:MAG: SDR family NAD(P)-dependent oxidoreductase [Gammaproteobacteria bacterium]